VTERPSATRVYGRPLVLEEGGRPNARLVEEHLNRVGYRAARGQEVGPGEYYLGSWGWIIGRRPFRGMAGIQGDWARELEAGGFVIARLDYSGRLSRMEDETGRRLPRVLLEPELIGRLSGDSDEDRLPVRLGDVPESLIAALLTVEDQRFFQHHGLDLRRIAAAAAANLKVGHVVQGGSTLTQQLAKNLYLSPRRSLDRKLREAALALALEARHSKEEILEAYLNEVYLGQLGAVELRGVGRAAEYFFGKDISTLDLAESALLVALIRAPSLYSPIRNPETALERRNLVLTLMRDEGRISEEELQEASAERLELRKRPDPIRSARYFVDFVAKEKAAGEASGGGRSAVVTTMDPRLQRAAEAAVRSGLSQLERDFDWLREGDGGEPLQAALVALDPRTGEILAMVGGRDYGASQFNRVVVGRRQPGSAFKPVVALAALARPSHPAEEDGQAAGGDPDDAAFPAPLPRFTLASVLQDEPLQVETPAGLWQPVNYDGSYEGAVTLRDALERSLNVPFARLGMEVGPERIVETARALGIESPLRPYLSLALGSGEVSPLELTRAFGVLAAQGFRADPQSDYPGPMTGGAEGPWWPGGDPRGGGWSWWDSAFPDPVDRVGDDSGAAGRRVFDRAETYLVTSALRGVVERGTGRSLRALGFRGDVAAKSGTTNDFRDGWFIGYTPSLVVGVWVGFDHGKRLELPGAGVALPIFAGFLKEAVGPDGDLGPWGSYGFSSPPGIEFVEVDTDTGLRGGWGCPGEPEVFLSGTAPEESCNGFRLDRRTFQSLVDMGGEEAIRLIRRLLGRSGGEDGGGERRERR
jgi:penicillin-binding protein 1B